MSAGDPAPLVTVELVITDDGWADLDADLETLVTRAAQAAHTRAANPGETADAVAVTLADDATLQTLNGQWRGKDKPTNVLSFPAGDMLGPDGPVFLGDIILARQTVAAEALVQGKDVDSHLTHLVVHGMLHLLGLDHETPEEAERMEALEREILLGFGIPDPYLLGPNHPEPTP